MRGDVRQHLAEVGELLRAVLLAGAVQILDERLHAVQAGFVKGSRILSAAKRNAPEPQVGSRIVIFSMACQKARSSSGPSQFSIASCANWRMSRFSVIRSLMSRTSPLRSLLSKLLVTLPAGHDLTPDLRGQSEIGGAGLFQPLRNSSVCTGPSPTGWCSVGGLSPTAISVGAAHVRRRGGRPDRCSGRGRPSAGPRPSGPLGFSKAILHLARAASKRNGRTVFLLMYSVMSSFV